VAQEDLVAQATQSAELTATKTSGRAKIEAGQSQLVIHSNKIGETSQVFVTPLGSTDNQVLYVKSQQADDPATEAIEGVFIIGFDQPASKDVLFNWWIVN